MMHHIARAGGLIAWDYAAWLVGLGIFFVVLERIRPMERNRPAFRRGLGTDLVYFVFNGTILGVLVAAIGARIVAGAEAASGVARALDLLRVGAITDAPRWVQFAVAVLAIDLLHWTIHRALHTVPVLWRFHQVHHSIVDFDWIGGIRFHCMEIVAYRTLTYFVVSFFGFGWPALFAHAVFTTLLTFYSHSNVDLPIGPLRWVINNPRMHRWHHAHPDCEAPVPRNFAITLSVWDWIFGTAFLPDGIPRRLGFPGVERYPGDVARQLVRPFIGESMPS